MVPSVRPLETHAREPAAGGQTGTSEYGREPVDRPAAAGSEETALNKPAATDVAGGGRWHYVQAGSRDLRLDLLRGYCALAMVVDHLGGASYLYPLTGGNRFFVSAAEGFIFLSGLLVGLIYGPRVQRDGLAAVQSQLLRRSFTLYGVTLGLTFTFVGLSRLADMPWLQDVEPLTPQLVAGLITLHHTYYLVDVMLLYTLLLALAPLALLGLHVGRTKVVVLTAVGLWAIYQWFPAQAEIPWAIANNDTFRFSAWQLWFFGGMIIGYHRNWIWGRLSRLPRSGAFITLTVAAAALIFLHFTGAAVDAIPAAGTPAGTPAGWIVSLTGGASAQGDRSSPLDLLFDKHSAGPGRIVAFAVFFPLLYLALTWYWRPIARPLAWLLIPFGQNALYVYAMHLFAIYFSALLLPYVPGYDRGTAWQNTLVQLLAVLVIWLLVKREVLFDVIPR